MQRQEASGYQSNLPVWQVALGVLLPAGHGDSGLPRGAVPHVIAAPLHAIAAPTNLLSQVLPGPSPTLREPWPVAFPQGAVSPGSEFPFSL